MTGIKFCGLRTMADVEAANRIRPDFAGFVFAEGKRRYVSPADAAELIAALDEGISPVGVFLDAEPAYAAECARISGVRYIQVHGDFDDARIAEMQQLSGLPVIAAFNVAGPSDIERARKSIADLILLDGPIAGSGSAFDWSLLSGLGREFILAGGLTIDNVNTAIHNAAPSAVDVSSGIETDGMKDPAKMAAFAAAVRGTDGNKGETQ